MKYWLIKSEPSVFSIDDLINSPNQTTYWEGVRNYQARNYLKNEMKKGDKAIFYHSNANPPSAVGIVEIVKEGYPDFTAFDKNHKYYDPKSSPENPIWFMVDVKFVSKFKNVVTLEEIKKNPKLSKLKLVQKGNRLSVMPITKEEFEEIINMSEIL
jgi:predicted RNA-binding protein with PUA-like domain